MFLNHTEITEMIKRRDIEIRPLLSSDQIGQITIDFRLGYDFLVAIQGRASYIDASLNSSTSQPIGYFFQETRRKIGETFLLHTNQTVLTSSLEYIKLPTDVFAVLNMRSSYIRLGVSISTIVQPGYCGCISLELTNTNKNPINLTVGAPLLQARFYRLTESSNYFLKERKYICQVRPKASSVTEDSDLQILHTLWQINNNRPIDK